MNAFSPRTFSTDWELSLLTRNLRIAENRVIGGIAGQLSAETGLPIHMDTNSVELGLGVNNSLAKVWKRIEDVTNRASSLAAAYECDVFPVASSPVEGFFNASHVHVGTLHDEAVGVRLERALMRYTPVFAALGANSPLWNFQPLRYKSYRVLRFAHYCTNPTEPRDPFTAQAAWGGDASPKLFGVPTLEVRIIDCASSRRMLAELSTFVAAYVQMLASREIDDSVDEASYMEYLNNRWLAARYGMQATFSWQGTPRPVAEIAGEMLDECGEALADLDTSRHDLGIIEQMVQKRICQADLALDIARRYDEPYCLLAAYAKRLRDWNAFEEYLASAPVLEPAPALTRADVLDEHESQIGSGTHFYVSRFAMSYPGPQADAVISELVESRRIVREVTPDGGIILSRSTSAV